ncbi:MAG: alpha/beta fold hydrolase [Acidobacteriota bacterium]|nr:alpha/beta fold hydrolase [Acidobacteriota bacterium]
MRAYDPLIRNSHVATILANFWPRKYDFSAYPVESHLIQTDEDTKVLVQTQRPPVTPIGHVVLLHGLEGSGGAGYIVSMAWHALQSGFIAHRFHMRTCGGTQAHCRTLYHGGLTSDLRRFLETLERGGLPVCLIGFSLGGNVALKLAGELGETELIQGVCAISTPIDLAAGVRRIGRRDNMIYERRFLKRMRNRLFATGRYTRDQLNAARSLYEIDDRITAPSFGFSGADEYYATQSSQNFLERIRVPTLLIQAKDDTFIPFEMYRHHAIGANPFIRLVATEHGGHLGFLSRRGPRFWLDDTALDFLKGLIQGTPEETGKSCGALPAAR